MPSGRHAPSHGTLCEQEGPLPLQGVIRAVAGINYPDTLLAVASLAAGEGRGWSGEHLLAAEQSFRGAQRSSWGSASMQAG